jgi:hypothetical protein
MWQMKAWLATYIAGVLQSSRKKFTPYIPVMILDKYTEARNLCISFQ